MAERERIRLKSEAEAAATIAEMRAIDRGMIPSWKGHALVWIALAAGLALRFPVLWGAALAVFLCDWIVFRVRRGRALRRFEAAPARLRTAADYEAVDRLYEREGRRAPTMDDWVRLASAIPWGERAGGSEGEKRFSGAEPAPGISPDDERYRAILAEYRRISPPPAVTVDVGANDGRAFADFGIGEGSLPVGIDISADLLRRFNRRVPGGAAVQADAAELPLLGGSAGFLFCTETLEHLAEPAAAVAEFARVLAPGGRLMIQSPNAHRIRNLNPLHLIVLAASLLTDRVLQKKTVHANTWHTAATYHWDFSAQDCRRMIRGSGMRIAGLSGSAFFCPAFLLRGDPGRYRLKERIWSALPLLRMLGDDIVVVAEKDVTDP
ncbi:MAG: class I SAM-dependent methyltransferase [Candidatus Krumholzibacteria bacterium]|nr:class I SAM-dependent methyltransferase [Candidatus Krumholzibacteria bacterium]